eukprot:6197008-Lingulodinium_polyedra.AAC.1
MLAAQSVGDRVALLLARELLRRARANWHRAKLRAEGGSRVRRVPARATPALRNAAGELEHDRSIWPALLYD